MSRRIALVATKVMGWTWDDMEGTWRTPEGHFEIAGWDPFTDIGAAWLVMEKMLTDEFVEAFHYELLMGNATHRETFADADIALLRSLTPECVCLCALKAYGVPAPTEEDD